MASIYSVRFICQAALNGNSATVTVPAGRVYIVKQLSAYANTTAVDANIFLVDAATGAALWRHNVPGGSANWGGDYGARVFEAGQAFYMTVDAAPIDSGDVFASGYDLST